MKRDETILVLEAALERILNGKPERISEDRELSTRAVEEEAGLDTGIMYHYPLIIEKFKAAQQEQSMSTGLKPEPDKQRPLKKVNDGEWVKVEYQEQVSELRNRLSNISAQLHETTDALVRAHHRIQELEEENTSLRRGN